MTKPPSKPAIKQLNVEVTQAVKMRLKQLERDLRAYRATPPEIVAVLIKTANPKEFPATALDRYRREAEKARAQK
jgi:hypothetical protein